MKRKVWIGVVLAAVLTLGVATVAAYAVSTHPPRAKASPTARSGSDQGESPDSGEAESAGVHGGSVERFHGDGHVGCDVPAGTSLTGNWTHGDYVSAWARAGSGSVRDAAQSPCGKPLKATQHPGPGGEGQGSRPVTPPGLSRRPSTPPSS
ncbi:MAG TPA: hypothetical protein VF972_08455 [Actinomycetota bacterium]